MGGKKDKLFYLALMLSITVEKVCWYQNDAEEKITKIVKSGELLGPRPKALLDQVIRRTGLVVGPDPA